MQYGARYDWTTSEQSFLLGSYFWGYFLTSLPGGMLAEWIGGRAVVGYTLVGSAICTALTPLAADISYWFVVTIRLMTGILAVSIHWYHIVSLIWYSTKWQIYKHKHYFSPPPPNYREFCILHCIAWSRNGHLPPSEANSFLLFWVAHAELWSLGLLQVKIIYTQYSFCSLFENELFLINTDKMVQFNSCFDFINWLLRQEFWLKH